MRVFISHGMRDVSLAAGIRDALTQQGFEVWNPERQLLPGDNWLLETGRALAEADAVVVLLSHESVDSPYTKSELQYVTSQPKYEGRVIPVRVGSIKTPVPWILASMSIIEAGTDPKSTAKKIAMRLKPLLKSAPSRTGRRSPPSAKKTSSKRH